MDANFVMGKTLGTSTLPVFFFIFFYEGQKGSNVPFISNQIAEIILKCLLKLRYSQTYGSELSCVTRNKLSEQNEEKLL